MFYFKYKAKKIINLNSMNQTSVLVNKRVKTYIRIIPLIYSINLLTS